MNLLQIRDSVASRTLASVGYTDTKDMTIENCVNFCNTRNFFYAGVENGQECRKCCLHLVHGPLSFPPLSFILTTRFGNKTVGTLYPAGPLHRNQIVTFRATAMSMKIVVPAIA